MCREETVGPLQLARGGGRCIFFRDERDAETTETTETTGTTGTPGN